MRASPPAPSSKHSPAERELWAMLALRHTPGIGPVRIKKICAAFPSAYQAVTGAAAWPSMGLARDDQAKAFTGREWLDEAKRERGLIASLGLDYLLLTDADYPERLKELPGPPPILYTRGDPTLFRAPAVAVVGARAAGADGLAAARSIAQGLSRAGIAVVSGLALGVDRSAHLGALQGPGSSIAVLGAGLDQVYPERNRDVYMALAGQGLLVSEFPPQSPPKGAHFPIRNRVIAGLSLAVVVIEASAKSGSLITARLAMEQGAEVFALPGPYGRPGYAGCHSLINQGARLFESVEKALLELAPVLGRFAARPARGSTGPSASGTRAASGPSGAMQPDAPPLLAAAAAPAPVGADEARVLSRLSSGEPVHIDTLCRELSLSGARAARAMIALELKGLVRKRPGMYYTAVVAG